MKLSIYLGFGFSHFHCYLFVVVVVIDFTSKNYSQVSQFITIKMKSHHAKMEAHFLQKSIFLYRYFGNAAKA